MTQHILPGSIHIRINKHGVDTVQIQIVTYAVKMPMMKKPSQFVLKQIYRASALWPSIHQASCSKTDNYSFSVQVCNKKMRQSDSSTIAYLHEVKIWIMLIIITCIMPPSYKHTWKKNSHLYFAAFKLAQYACCIPFTLDISAGNNVTPECTSTSWKTNNSN